MMWFFGVLGASIAIAWIGWKKSSPKQRDSEKYWQKVKEACVYNAEHVYCRK